MSNNVRLYALTEEHEAVREAVRDIAEREIAPYAAEVDADSRFPAEAQKALTAAGFHATHIPEAYGGERLARFLREARVGVHLRGERGDLAFGDVADRLADGLVLLGQRVRPSVVTHE